MRLRVTETPVFTEAVLKRGKVERNPATAALRMHPRNFMVVLGSRLAENGLGYLFPVFGLSYVINTLGVPRQEALSALMLAFVIELFTILGFAALSDKIGRKPVYMFGALRRFCFCSRTRVVIGGWAGTLYRYGTGCVGKWRLVASRGLRGYLVASHSLRSLLRARDLSRGYCCRQQRTSANLTGRRSLMFFKPHNISAESLH